MIRLIVKGTPAEVQNAAAAHGVSLLGPPRPHARWDHCFAATHSLYTDVANWFHGPDQSAPFPPGTLLHFTVDP